MFTSEYALNLEMHPRDDPKLHPQIRPNRLQIERLSKKNDIPKIKQIIRHDAVNNSKTKQQHRISNKTKTNDVNKLYFLIRISANFDPPSVAPVRPSD